MRNTLSMLSQREDGRLVLRSRIILVDVAKRLLFMRVSERVSAEEGERGNVRANVCVITLTDHSIDHQQTLNKIHLATYKETSEWFNYFAFIFQGCSKHVSHVGKLT